MTKYSGHKWLCQAWGETDLPAARICSTRDEVAQFFIDEWMGDKDSDELAPAMERFDTYDWDADWKLTWTFEIGGVSVKRVFESGSSAAGGAEPGEWRHSVGGQSNGYLMRGTLRVAREDFDTQPSAEFRKETFDAIVNKLNAHPSVAGMPDEIPNEVCQAGMNAWQNTLGSPYTRYAAIYKAMRRALGGA